MAQMVKNPPAVQKTWVRFLGQEDPLEKGMAAHSSVLAWKILWTEEPGSLQSMGSQRVGYSWETSTWLSIKVSKFYKLCPVIWTTPLSLSPHVSHSFKFLQISWGQISSHTPFFFCFNILIYWWISSLLVSHIEISSLRAVYV